MFGLFSVSKEHCATIRLVKTWHTHQHYTFDLPGFFDEFKEIISGYKHARNEMVIVGILVSIRVPIYNMKKVQ